MILPNMGEAMRCSKHPKRLYQGPTTQMLA